MNVRVQVDGQVYEVEIGDLNSRPIQAVVGSELFVVWPEEAPAPVVSPAATAGALPRVSAPAPIIVAPSGEAEIIAAPLPGDVVAVAVKPGDAVTAGQLLCTVESMKMNNPVRSPRPGVVAEVMVAVGDHVNHGQPLVRLS
jgi:biotin carboxyl carrier protein